MYRILLTTALIAATLSVPALGTAQEADNQRPNVVLIITDDVGYGDFSSYGAPDVRTPHVDGLARDGTPVLVNDAPEVGAAVQGEGAVEVLARGRRGPGPGRSRRRGALAGRGAGLAPGARRH